MEIYNSALDAQWLESDERLPFIGQWVCLQEGKLLDSDSDVGNLRRRIISQNPQKNYVITKVYF